MHERQGLYEYKNTTLVLPRLSYGRFYKIKFQVSPKLKSFRRTKINTFLTKNDCCVD